MEQNEITIKFLSTVYKNSELSQRDLAKVLYDFLGTIRDSKFWIMGSLEL